MIFWSIIIQIEGTEEPLHHPWVKLLFLVCFMITCFFLLSVYIAKHSVCYHLVSHERLFQAEGRAEGQVCENNQSRANPDVP